MTQADKQHRVTQYMGAFATVMIFIILFLAVMIFLPRTGHNIKTVVQTDKVSAQTRNLNNRWNRLQHQDYITFDQFYNLFSAAKAEKDDKLINQMNLTRIVNDDNGHVYCVNIEKTKKDYTYTLQPVQDAQGNLINPYWLDQHTVNRE